MNIKLSKEISEIVEVLKKMAMFEVVIAELYSLCAVTWKEDSQFWLDIWKDEVKHAQYINRIIEIISKYPDDFEKGRPFNALVVETTVAQIRKKIEKVKKGEIDKNTILFIANDLEKGYLEDKYSEIVRTDNVEYKALIQKVVEDTGHHKQKIIQRIKEMQSQRKNL